MPEDSRVLSRCLSLRFAILVGVALTVALAPLPVGQNTPERECWYINMGAVDRSFFTTEAIVRAAR
jgi:hypothetical protein